MMIKKKAADGPKFQKSPRDRNARRAGDSPRKAVAPGRWETMGRLLPPVAVNEALELFPAALEKVWPLKAARRRQLPEDIAALSYLLTSGRADLRKPYWSAPAFISAYLYYFLPWNLVRLGSLLAGLPISAPEDARDLHPALLDAASGPLTLPMALWLARPQWRSAPLTIFASDRASQPLALGIKIFKTFAALLGQPLWRLKAMRGGIESLAQNFFNFVGPDNKYRVWLVSAANIFNETRSKRRADTAEEDFASPLEDEELATVLDNWAPLFIPRRGCPPPELLFVEPGSRLGGECIMKLREAALEAGLNILAPCVGQGPCPLLKHGAAGTSYSSTWCHFSLPTAGAPAWLGELSREAGLAKKSLSLSTLFLTTAEKQQTRERGLARVISGPFDVPGIPGQARYGCSGRGLLLLGNAAAAPSGALTRARETGARDGKSGALLAEPFTPDNARKHNGK